MSHGSPVTCCSWNPGLLLANIEDVSRFPFRIHKNDFGSRLGQCADRHSRNDFRTAFFNKIGSIADMRRLAVFRRSDNVNFV
jgi:hypothetical protein